MNSRKSILDIQKMKGVEKICSLTAYDYVTAGLLDQAGCDIILIGDSLGNVILGFDSTLPVTMEDILRHSAAVSRASHQALLVADMPFLSYQVDQASGVLNAGKLLSDGGVQAVKLEGGERNRLLVSHLTEIGIPVMGHIGLTPQSVNGIGGYRRFGKSASEIEFLHSEAKALEAAGAFAIVLECVQPEVAATLTKSLKIPTIGIASGDDCDGQILVINDLLGYGLTPPPPFVKPALQLASIVRETVSTYVKKVKTPCS